eukprot:sb/3476832/
MATVDGKMLDSFVERLAKLSTNQRRYLKELEIIIRHVKQYFIDKGKVIPYRFALWLDVVRTYSRRIPDVTVWDVIGKTYYRRTTDALRTTVEDNFAVENSAVPITLAPEVRFT